MKQTTQTTPQQVRVAATLDVQSVERELNHLWAENAGARDEEGALMRARVLNLLVYVSSDESLGEVNELLSEVTAAHPCRALVMVAEQQAEDNDIEMFVSSYCQSSGDTRHLCCEQVTLKACGRFTVELPSAAGPLLVPDLPVFLWWREQPRLGDEVFRKLSRASDRVIVDSADFRQPYVDLFALDELLQKERARHTGVSDLNWARLTSWRGLLANLYDVRENLAALDKISRVRIEYVAPEYEREKIAPKALILAGWLMSRLGWRVSDKREAVETGGHAVHVEREGREIIIEFESVERSSEMSGWIASIELSATEPSPYTFTVARSQDGRFLETRTASGEERRASRLLVGGDKSEAELLGRELEILSHDRIYEEAVRAAVSILKALSAKSEE